MTLSSIEKFCITNANNIASAQCEQDLSYKSAMELPSPVDIYFPEETLGMSKPKTIGYKLILDLINDELMNKKCKNQANLPSSSASVIVSGILIPSVSGSNIELIATQILKNA